MSKIRLHGTSSGYTEIVPKAAAASNTLTAPSTVGEIIAKDAAGAIGITSAKTDNINVGAAVTITASGINATGVGVTVASINEGPIGGRRNIIINGACNVAQRGTSDTSDVQGYTTVDRFKIGWGGANAIIETHQESLSSSDTGPWAEGFRNAYKLVNGDQSSGAQSGDYAEIQYKVEAQDMSSSGWNYTSTTDFVTLSFWVKSSVAQNYYGFVFSSDGTSQRYIFETGSLSVNTWKKVILTIPGASNVQFDNNTGEGLIIKWIPFYGTDFTASATLNTWAAYSGSARTPDNTATWWTTNDATFHLTGIQLERGSVATPFEHRSIGDELALCQRYYNSIGYGSGNFIINSINNNAARVAGPYLSIRMRAVPTLTAAANLVEFSSGTNRSVSDFHQKDQNGGGYVQLGADTVNGVYWKVKYDAEL